MSLNFSVNNLCNRQKQHFGYFPKWKKCAVHWCTMGAVEYATLEWVDWLNHWQLLESICEVSPAEFEQTYYDGLDGQAFAA
jgi:hypothetical protein